MEKISFKDFKNGKGFYDTYLRDELILVLEAQGLKDNDILVNFAYTDYGGDFLDNVCIEYFSNKQYDNTFEAHKTAYYGKNGILWGSVASEFWQAFERYPLGFENLEDFYSQKESDAKADCITRFLNEYQYNDENLQDELKTLLYDYLNLECYDLFGHVLSSGDCDYSSDEVEKEVNHYIDEVYPLILSQKREALADNQYIGKIQ